MHPSLPTVLASSAPQALVVLGCKVDFGQPGPAMARRLVKARAEYAASPHLPVIMSGGKSWHGFKESTCMARWWTEHLTPHSPVIEERQSLTTEQNARYVSEICKQLEYSHIALITCDFHMARAQRLFEKYDLQVTPVRARSYYSWTKMFKVQCREWGARLLELKTDKIK